MSLGSQKLKISPRGETKMHRFWGIEKARILLRKMLIDPRPIIVYFDPDVDGAIAGYLVCKYLRKVGHEFQWYINSNRSHDWSLPKEKVKGRNIIAVDFIITAEKVRELSSLGCNLLSMDHHNNGSEAIECHDGGDCMVINNQYSFEDDDGRYLSGAGVVFEVLSQIDEEFDTELNRQLVGITLLSDIRDIENPLAEGYLYLTYSGKYDGFLRRLIDSTMGDRDNSFGVPRMDRNYIDYKFSPALNACFRFNRQGDVVKFLLGVGELSTVWRDKQKSLVKELQNGCKVIELNHTRIVYFNEIDFLAYSDVLSNFVGLLASRYLDGDKSVICYMIQEEDGRKFIKRASMRGRINGIDYNSSIQKLGVCDCRGHNSAFGMVGLKPSKDVFLEVDKVCGVLESECQYQRPVIECANLSMFLNSPKSFYVAEDNMYKLSQNQTVIKYTGGGYRVKREGASYREYEVDGIPVLSFNLKSTFSSNYISLVLDRGNRIFYLE